MLSELKLLLIPDDKLISALKHFNPRKPLKVNQKRIGNSYDGGYIMIDDFIKKDGIAYSFGVGRNVSWETQMSNLGDLNPCQKEIPIHRGPARLYLTPGASQPPNVTSDTFDHSILKVRAAAMEWSNVSEVTFAGWSA